MQANLCNIEASHLNLSKPVQKEVCQAGCHTYRQYVTLNKNKLTFQTLDFQVPNLTMRADKTFRSICIPVEPWLRQQMNVLENFVKENVNIPDDVANALGHPSKYKPLWDGERMFISVSKWCNFLRYTGNDGVCEQVTPDFHFGSGMYNVNIEVPYIYIGPHKDGYTFSLTLRIVQVVFKPNVIAVALSSQVDTPAITKSPPATKPKRSRKKKKEEEDVLGLFETLLNNNKENPL